MARPIRHPSRLVFLASGAAAGAGLVLGLRMRDLAGRDLDHGHAGPRAAADGRFSPVAFLTIGADNSVTIRVARSEMGQGVRSSLPGRPGRAVDPAPGSSRTCSSHPRPPS
jgi:isoquinoline 1-oxidoreductase beta subunit